MTGDMHSPAPLLSDVAGVVMADGAGRFLLQRRDDDPRISSPNRISVFGGHREGAETAEACALREVEEETGCRLRPDQIDLIGRTRIGYGTGGVRAGSFYFADSIDPAQFHVTEGQLEIIAFDALPDYFFQMVPTTAYVLALLCSQVADGSGQIAGVLP